MRKSLASGIVLLLATFASAQQPASVLIIQSTPGGAQVYVDDELRGTTSQQGRLRVSTLKLGKHVLQVSLSGYDDWQGDAALRPGQSLTKLVTLNQKAAAQTPRAEDPSLEAKNQLNDIMVWIRDHLEHPVVHVDFGQAFDVAHTYTIVLAGTGCGVSIHEDENFYNFASGAPSYNQFVDFSTTLGSLRPDVGRGQTGDGKPTLIVLAVNDMVFSNTYDNGGAGHTSAQRFFTLIFDTQSMRDRQAQAWRDAITACGGKAPKDNLY